MFRHLSFLCFVLAMIVPSMTFAASKEEKGDKVGKIRAASEEAKRRSGSCDEGPDWQVPKGALFSHDCFKTGKGGYVQLQLKGDAEDRITIGERSLVYIYDWLDATGDKGYRIKSDIKKGLMAFRAEKNKGHEAEFRTGTAAASIRGTEGAIGFDGNKSMFAGLKNGKLAVRDTVTGDSLFVGAGETVVGREKFVVLKLQSSGDAVFALKLLEIISDTTKSLDELKGLIEAADKEYQKSLQASAATEDSEKNDDAEKMANLNVPGVSYTSYDSLRCVANVSVSNMQKGTDARLSALMDGSPLSEVVVKRNMPKRFSLRSGVHEYEFVVENDAGKNSVKKTLGCYPMKPFSVKVFGKSHEYIQVPPAPPSVPDDDGLISQTLQFQIRLPENDPSFLNKVTVRQNGKIVLQERLSQIENLDYQIQMDFKRGTKNRVVVEVVHKSGFVVKASKLYEVAK
jgi:hypothetical protein